MNKRFQLSLLLVLVFLVSSTVFSQTQPLTEEQITRTAADKAKELGYKPEAMNVVFDRDNKGIKEFLERTGVSTLNPNTGVWEKDSPTTPEQEYPELQGKDYQAVYFGPKEVMKGGDLWVFVDRSTGEVLKSERGK